MRFFKWLRHSNRRKEETRGLRILLVEDTRVNQIVTVCILEKHAHSVMIAEDGRKALELLAQYPFDLVLMDVEMPIMDGLEATRKIRNSQFTFSNIPILAMTAHGMKTYQHRCLNAGMNDYILKPIKSEELLAAISRCVAGGGISAGKDGYAPKPGEPSVESVVDVTEAMVRMGGDAELFRDVMAIFLEDVRERLKILTEGIEKADWEVVGKNAHRIKGAAASLSVHAMRETASELERSAGNKDLGNAREALARLKVEMERVEQFALGHFLSERTMNSE